MRDENHWDSQSKARKAQNSIQHILHAEEGHVSHTHLEANNEMVLGDRDEVVRFQREFHTESCRDQTRLPHLGIWRL